MILGIIIIIASIILGFINYSYWNDWDDGLPYMVGGFIIGFFIMLLSQFIYSTVAKQEITETTEIKIYTLQTSMGVNGAFCLGYGSVSTDPYYYFYIKDDNGLYQLMDLDSDDVKLKLTDDEEPKLITYKYSSVDNNWFFGFGEPWDIFSYYKYELIVPTDTIQLNYYNGMLNR